MAKKFWIVLITAAIMTAVLILYKFYPRQRVREKPVHLTSAQCREGKIQNETSPHINISDTNVNTRDQRERTPLMWAIKYNDFKKVKKLLKAEAKINIQDHRGWSPLIYAVNYRSPKIVELLLENHVKVNMSDQKGKTALMYTSEYSIDDNISKVVRALIEGHIAVLIRKLLQSGAKVNIQDKDGWTPLMYAAKYRWPASVKILLEAGANPSIKNSDGLTAVDLAQQNPALNGTKILEKATGGQP